jgi:hypothetical protein
MNSYKTSAIVNDRWNDLGFCLARVLRLAVIATLHGALMFPLLSVLLGAAAQPALAQTESVLYSFTGGTDGAYPYGTLVRDAKTGNLYGTAAFGGNPSCVHKPPGCGVVFEVFPTGIEKVLYSFNGGTDGEWPFDGLLRVGGNFYGTAFAEGLTGRV